jgi:hypothetical protein
MVPRGRGACTLGLTGCGQWGGFRWTGGGRTDTIGSGCVMGTSCFRVSPKSLARRSGAAEGSYSRRATLRLPGPLHLRVARPHLRRLPPGRSTWRKHDSFGRHRRPRRAEGRPVSWLGEVGGPVGGSEGGPVGFPLTCDATRFPPPSPPRPALTLRVLRGVSPPPTRSGLRSCVFLRSSLRVSVPPAGTPAGGESVVVHPNRASRSSLLLDGHGPEPHLLGRFVDEA